MKSKGSNHNFDKPLRHLTNVYNICQDLCKFFGYVNLHLASRNIIPDPLELVYHTKHLIIILIWQAVCFSNMVQRQKLTLMNTLSTMLVIFSISV